MVPRARRIDVRGACFHVENRALDGRTLFERPDDARDFLSRIARVVRGRHLDLHAYALLPSRFHLLVSSPEGRLAEGLGRVQDAYARELNRRLGRRGPLFRGRYRARLLAAHVHRAAVLGYVHESPVRAGLAESPAAYPYGSARLVRVSLRPPWLDARLLERWGGADGAPTVAWDLVGRWLEQADADPPDLDALVLASPADLQAWLAAERGAHVLVRAATLAHVLASARRTAVGLALRCGRRPGAWDLLEAGLLRTVCGLTYAEVAERLGVAATTAHARVRLHFGALGGAAYAGTAGAVLHCALGLEYGALLSPLGRALPERRSG
jgi:hypothetical protein